MQTSIGKNTKVLLDNNILLDVLMKRLRFFESSKRVYLSSVYGVITAYITTNMITDLYYVLSQKLPSAKEEISKIIQLTEVLPVTVDSCLKALESKVEGFEDSLIVEVAKENGIEVLITRNKKDFEQSGLLVFTPEEFLKELEEYGV